MKTFEFIQTGFFVLSIIGTFCGFIYFQILKDDDSFQKLKGHLLKNDPLERYHGIIRDLLTKSETFIGTPFHFKTYDKILLISLAYPFLFLLIGYLLSGNNLIGGLQIFPHQPNPYLRVGISLLFFALFYIVITLLLSMDKIESYRTKKFQLKNESLEIFISGLLPAAVVTGTITLIGLLGVFLFDFMEIFGFGALTLMVSIFILLIYDGSIETSYLAAAFIFIVGLFGFFGGKMSLIGTQETTFDTILVVVFFFVVLPISNSIFDYISFEVSRFLTKKTVSISNKLSILVILLFDFVVGVILLVGTAYIIPFFIIIYDFLVASIDWQNSALIAKEEPFSKGLGITLMLFSTLIWTGIHSIIAFGSLIFAPFGRTWVVAILNKTKITNIDLSFVAFWLSLNFALSAICLFFVPWYIISNILEIPIATLLYDFMMNFHILL